MQKTPWGKVFLVFAVGVTAAAQFGVIAPIVPALQAELGLSLPFTGLVISALTLIATGFGLVSGAWTERIGLARSVKIGLALVGLVTAAGALAPNGAVLLATRVAEGIGYLMVVTAAPALLSGIEKPGDRAVALALFSTFVPVGIALAGAGDALLLDRIGWRGVLWADAGMMAAAFLVAVIGLRDSGPKPANVAAATWGILRQREPLLLTLGFLCFTFTYLVLAGLLPAFLAQTHGMPASAGGRVIAYASLGAAAGGIVAGGLMRVGMAPMLLAALGLIVPAIAAFAMFAPGLDIGWVVAATWVAFVVGELVPAAAYTVIPLIARDEAAIAPINGLLVQLGSLGTLIGPPVYAAWAGKVGWALSPILLAVVGIVGAGCMLAVGNKSGRARV